MAGTSVFRGRDQETFQTIDLTGSTGRALTAVEAQIKTLRFIGTLGQSVTMRVPLSATENPGYTGTFENATSGGFTITISPASGSGVDVAPGAAISCYYDGSRMIGQAAAAATGFSGLIGDAITVIPITILDPQIGDAITYIGPGGFENTPSGGAIGSPVSGGTVGSVLFVGATSLLGQDNANLFWDDTNNRLGIGTAAPLYRLHVKDPTTFSSVTFELGDDAQQAALRVYPGIAASGGNTLVESGGLILRGHYWSGAASVSSDAWWRVSMAATVPTFYLVAGVGAAEKLWIRNNGQIYMGMPTPSADADAVVIGAVGALTRFKGHVHLDDGVDIITHNGAGTRFGTANSSKMAWWGNDARARGAVTGATTEALLDNTLTYLSSIGIIEPFVSPLSVAPWLFIDPRNFTGSHNDPVSTLTDISGNSRSPLAAGSLRGLLQVSANLSPNGSRTISLDGVDDSYDFTGTMFAVTSGVMITIAGNFSTNAGAGQVIFTDNTAQRPQCIVETFTTNLYAFRDEGHTATFGGFSGGWQVLQWVFRPPSGGTGVAELWKNGALLGSSTWNWNPGSSSGFIISGGPLPAKVLLGPIIVTPGDVSDGTRQGLVAWIGAHY